MNKTVPGKLPLGSITRYLFCLGLASLAFVFLTFAVAVLGFMVKVPVTPYHMVIALAGTALVCVFLSWYYFGEKRSVDVKSAASMMVVLAALLFACWLAAHSIYDLSYDGLWYHQGAVLQMMNGYNPVYGQVPDSYSGAEFIGHYPKAMEISSAVIDAFTGHIEDGKLLNFWLMATAFLLIFPAIVFSFPDLDVKYGLVIAALCAFNPVSVYQSLSYYVDGVSASLLAILVFLLIVSLKKIDGVLFSAITAAAVVAINLKFFDLVYVGIIIVGFIAIATYNKKATVLHYLLILSLAAGVLFGINPYIYNFVDHGTPFYPVEGISTSMITGDTPQNLVGQNSVEQFFYSIFSRGSVEKSNATLKIPLTLGDGEADTYRQTDTRAGGFGPFFSAAFIVTAIIAVVLIYMDTKEKRLLKDPLLPVCALILISVFVNPAGWWARYVPQFWLVPLLLLLYSCRRFKGGLKLLNFALIAILAANVLLIACVYYPYQASYSADINSQLKSLKAASVTDAVELYPGIFPVTEERFKEYGINYVVIDRLKTNDKGFPLLGAYGMTSFYVGSGGISW